jgi:hypothetical protein
MPFAIITSIFFSIAIYHLYVIVWKVDPTKKHFYLIQLGYQLLLLILSIIAVSLMILSTTGHHVYTELENILTNVLIYICLATIIICIINIAITLFKNFKKIKS